jgi:hypothetical protein
MLIFFSYATKLAHTKFPQTKGRKRKRSQEAQSLPLTARPPRTRVQTRSQTSSTLPVSEGTFGENTIEAFRTAHSSLITDASRYLSQCITDHVKTKQCPPNSKSPGFLPTRLIDLKNLTAPRLVLSCEIPSGDLLFLARNRQ